METFILWFILSTIPAFIAVNKGRSGAGFFFLSILLSPIVGIIVALVVKSNGEQLAAEQITSGERKNCLYCAEMIKRQAKICRYCGKDQIETENELRIKHQAKIGVDDPIQR